MQAFENFQTKLGKFRVSESHLEEVWNARKDGKIPLFKLLDTILSNRYLDTDNSNTILSDLFLHHFGFYQSRQKLELEQIAAKSSYTRERVRQIKEKLIFNTKFEFIQHLSVIDDLQPDPTQDFISISTNEREAINSRNGTDFSARFIAMVYGVLAKDNFLVVGDYKKSDWKSIYLVNKNLQFNFNGLVSDFRIQLKPYPVRHQQGLLAFDKAFHTIPNSSEITVIKKLIALEFEDKYFSDEGIILPKTKQPNLVEILEQILTDLGPSRKGYPLSMIQEQLSRKQSKHYQKSSVRTSLNNDARFQCFGKTSTYVLTAWMDDPSLGIYGGDYILLSQTLLELERLPLTLEQLFLKIEHHRTDPNKNSIEKILRDTPDIFYVNRNLFGLKFKPEHLRFGQAISSLPDKYLSKSFWNEQLAKQKDPVSDLIKYGLDVYAIDLVKEFISRLPDAIGQMPIQDVKSFTEAEVRAITLQLEALGTDSEQKYSKTLVRREHILLRKLLFQNRRHVNCALCGRNLPVKLMAVAHIKRRSLASPLERLDSNIVMAACTFGCDALFERGYIAVDKNGIVSKVKANIDTEDLDSHIRSIVGRRCEIYNMHNQSYFEEHLAFHSSRSI